MSYVNFHTHCREGSLLDGDGKLDTYYSRANELGLSGLAITDHGNLYSLLSAYETAQKHGVKHIPGMEAYQSRKTRFDQDEEERSGKANDELEQRGPYHLTVLARNNTGWKNLIKLSSQAYLSGYYGKPRIDHELLEQHSDGLIVCSGCLNGEVAQAILRKDYPFALKVAGQMQEMVGKDHFGIEVMNHGLEEQKQVLQELVTIAKKIQAPIIPTCDAHYVYREDSSRHDHVLCVATASSIADEKRFRFFNDQFYLKSYDEMAELFDPSWLKNTLDLAEQVEIGLDFGELHFPEFPLPLGKTTDGYFEELAREGLRKRFGDNPSKEVMDRFDYELGVIKDAGFPNYFLVVADLINWARSNDILIGPGRGSAAGCIISYAMEITNLDPILFKLPFERFLVPGRKSPPDIDFDIDDRYRDRVIEYARNRYGADRVSHIITFTTEGARAAIRDAARILAHPYEEGDRLSKALPPAVLGVNKSLDESLKYDDFNNAINENGISKEIVDVARGLEGLIRQTGVHAAGVVIAPSDITDYIPVLQKGKDTPVITQWSMEQVEQCKLLKIDFLALTTLAVIDICLKSIKERHGVDIDIYNLPFDDNVYKELRQGRTIGLFQVESRGLQELLVAMQPTCMEDIMIAQALYRPGPMGSGVDKIFIARRNGKEKTTYLHPKMADVLSTTYGLQLYQEDLLAVSKHLAGFNAAESDDLRKIVGKKQMDKIGKIRSVFVEGCRKHSDIPEHIANKIFSEIEYFAGYGFGRAHAGSYSVITYITGYLKLHYPIEFMSALLSRVEDKEKMGQYVKEAQRLGIKVLPPSVNRSDKNFRILSDNEIIYGLLSVAGLGDAAVQAVIRSRDPEHPYVSVYDFLRRCDIDVLHKKTLEQLAFSGALDELVPELPSRLMAREETNRILALEKERLGAYISGHPLAGMDQILAQHSNHDIAHANQINHDAHTKVAGIITSVERKTTKKGDLMFTFQLEDMTGSIECIVWPNLAKKLGDRVYEGNVCTIDCRAKRSSDDEENFRTSLIVMKMSGVTMPVHALSEPIQLYFDVRPEYNEVERISKIIDDNPGDCPVFITFPENNRTVTLGFKKPTMRGVL